MDLSKIYAVISSGNTTLQHYWIRGAIVAYAQLLSCGGSMGGMRSVYLSHLLQCMLSAEEALLSCKAPHYAPPTRTKDESELLDALKYARNVSIHPKKQLDGQEISCGGQEDGRMVWGSFPAGVRPDSRHQLYEACMARKPVEDTFRRWLELAWPYRGWLIKSDDLPSWVDVSLFPWIKWDEDEDGGS